MKRFMNEPIGDMRAVEVTGVDVIDPTRHGFPQHDDRCMAVLGRSEHAGSGELHRAIAQTLDGAATQRECARGGEIGHCEISPGWKHELYEANDVVR